MKTATLYARFSPRPGAETCESIEMQLERGRAQCKAKGWQIGTEHEDRELSGKRSDNRPGLQAALQDVCQTKGVLVVYSLSRLSRSTKDAIEIADRLNHCNADLYSLNESIDTTSPTGRFTFTLFAALAQLEREQTAVRTSDAMQRMAGNGLRVSRHPPYGYKVDPDDTGLLVKDDYEQEVIRRIVYMYRNETQSPKEIADKLTELGNKPRAGRWYHGTVKNILVRAEVWNAGGSVSIGGNMQASTAQGSTSGAVSSCIPNGAHT